MNARQLDLEQPRFENGKPLLIAGLNGRCSSENSDDIPAQWQRFQPYIGNILGQVGQTAYGVIYNSDGAGRFDYLSGVEVSDFSRLSDGLSRVQIPAQRYAVFSHRGHVSAIRSTCDAIWNKWLPESGHQAAGGPFFERYGKEFNPQAGMGGVEIWIAIKT